jgi:hypothetical protein
MSQYPLAPTSSGEKSPLQAARHGGKKSVDAYVKAPESLGSVLKQKFVEPPKSEEREQEFHDGSDLNRYDIPQWGPKWDPKTKSPY